MTEARGGPAGPSRAQAAEDWRADYFRAIPELEEFARKRTKPFQLAVMRSSQLDAGRLDVELASMLHEQFMKVFSMVQPRLLNALKPELCLILDFLIFRFSIWKGKPSPGSVLMNLRYRDERATQSQLGGRTGVQGPGLRLWQRASLGLAFVFGQYAWGRLENIAAAYHWVDGPQESAGSRSWHLMQRLETGYRLASLLNFLAFLRHGKYRTAKKSLWTTATGDVEAVYVEIKSGVARSVIERLVGARLVYKRANAPRALSFEYLNRQLVWHELSEILLFVLPLINVARVKNLLLKTLPSVRAPAGLPTGPDAAQSGIGSCQVCGRDDVVVPYVALPCEHLFCYYCLRARTEAQPGFECPTCGARVLAMRRFRSDLQIT